MDCCHHSQCSLWPYIKYFRTHNATWDTTFKCIYLLCHIVLHFRQIVHRLSFGRRALHLLSHLSWKGEWIWNYLKGNRDSTLNAKSNVSLSHYVERWYFVRTQCIFDNLSDTVFVISINPRHYACMFVWAQQKKQTCPEDEKEKS